MFEGSFGTATFQRDNVIYRISGPTVRIARLDFEFALRL
jgi:hypothetical protein